MREAGIHPYYAVQLSGDPESGPSLDMTMLVSTSRSRYRS